MFASLRALVLVIVGAIFTLTAALADDVARDTGQSKEHPELESEGSFELPDFLKFIRKISPRDGRVRVSLNSNGGFTQAAYNTNTYDLALETVVFGTTRWKYCPDGQETYSGTRCAVEKLSSESKYAIMPVEFRFSVKRDDMTSVDLRDLRVGAVRILTDSLGLTSQLASFVLKEYPGSIGTFIGAEVASFALKGSAPVSKNGTLEFVVKGEVGLAFGATTGGDARENIQSAADESGRATRISKYTPFTAHVPLRGSVGLRAWKGLMVDLYAGLDFDDNHSTATQYDSASSGAGNMGNDSRENATSDYLHTYAGVGVRGSYKGFVLSGSVQKEAHKRSFSYEWDYKERVYNPETGNTATTYQEENASEHSQRDSGYNAMFSLGYDW